MFGGGMQIKITSIISPAVIQKYVLIQFVYTYKKKYNDQNLMCNNIIFSDLFTCILISNIQCTCSSI